MNMPREMWAKSHIFVLAGRVGQNASIRDTFGYTPKGQPLTGNDYWQVALDFQ